MIILNERKWAEEIIATHELGKEKYRALCAVARYYMEQGYTKKEAREALEKFLLECDPTISIPKWSKTIDYAVVAGTRYKSIQIDSIKVTKEELDVISKIESMPVQRLAFTLLCLAKYWVAVNPETDYWVNNKDSEIMRIANINTSIKRQSFMYNELGEMGLIQFSKKVDNTNVRVTFATEGETVIEITDFDNLGYQYMKYKGLPYFTCEICGRTLRRRNPKKGRKQKYCDECAMKRKLQQNVESVMRKKQREADNEHKDE